VVFIVGFVSCFFCCFMWSLGDVWWSGLSEYVDCLF